MKVFEIRIENLNNSFNEFKKVFNEALTGNVKNTEDYIAFSSIASLCKILKLLDDLKKEKYDNLKILEELGIVKKSKENKTPQILYDQINIKVKL